MTCEINHADIVEREARGEVLIGIEPAIARRFFTNTNHRAIQEEIDESLYVERSLVKTFFCMDYLSLLTCIVASIAAIKWFSFVSIPMIVVAWFLFGGKASMGHQKVAVPIGLVILFLLIAYFFKEISIAIAVWVALLPLPYFFAALTYKCSTVFLRCLSIRNEKAFKLLYGDAIFLKEV